MSKKNKEDAGGERSSGQSNTPISAPPHALSHEQVCEELSANTQDGLSVDEARKRLEEYGRNELDDGPGVQPAKILVRQVANAMMLVELPIHPLFAVEIFLIQLCRS